MEERKDPRAATGGGEKGAEGRDAEATSGETLSDLEESQKVSGGKTNATAGESGDASNVPSPDGAFDEGRGGSADSRGTGDPM